ncbi:MAG: 16S rRNA (guanine(527)-N(7))-methyltransferase RsmG [Porticoccaceae bacterium]
MRTDPADLGGLLSAGLSALGLETCPVREQKLLDYVALMRRWNRVYNLTAVRDSETMIDRHLIDSLAVAPYLRGGRFLDVGSGAGLPGIPLAIWFPERRFTLLDSNGRKTRFLVQAKIELGLTNVEVIQARVQDVQIRDGYDGILSRAFSSLADLVNAAGRLLVPEGTIYAFKGARPDAELCALPKTYRVRALRSLAIPGTDADRHLVELMAHTDNS